jgi:hypothetical protein
VVRMATFVVELLAICVVLIVVLCFCCCAVHNLESRAASDEKPRQIRIKLWATLLMVAFGIEIESGRGPDEMPARPKPTELGPTGPSRSRKPQRRRRRSRLRQ